MNASGALGRCVSCRSQLNLHVAARPQNKLRRIRHWLRPDHPALRQQPHPPGLLHLQTVCPKVPLAFVAPVQHAADTSSHPVDELLNVQIHGADPAWDLKVQVHKLLHLLVAQLASLVDRVLDAKIELIHDDGDDVVLIVADSLLLVV